MIMPTIAIIFAAIALFAARRASAAAKRAMEACAALDVACGPPKAFQAAVARVFREATDGD